IGQRRSQSANQATIEAGEGSLKSLRPQATGHAELEGDRLGAPTASLNDARSPPYPPPSRGPRLWTAGGRELRLKSRPPAHLVSLSNNQRLRTLQRTETQKQLSH